MYMPSPYRMLVQKFVNQLEADGPTEASASALIRNDAVAHVPGAGRLAGDYVGPAGFAELFASQRRAATREYDLELQTFDVQHSLAAAVVRIGAHREGASYRDTIRLVMSLEGGKIKELWLDPVDAAAFDAFFT
jgi:ketosteroid isomerase-like protein